MMHHILNRVEKVWEFWEIRSFVLFSLFLQVVLVFSGKYRARNKSQFVAMIMWLAYLPADWVATFALGVLSNNRNSTSYGLANRDLHTFWAPFLLLHLGGPDNITVYSVDDNKLWRSHLLGLVFQVTMVIYAFVRSWSSTKLLVSAILMFFAGIIKYAEKSYALWCASEGVLQKSLGTNQDPSPNYVDKIKRDEFENEILRREYATFDVESGMSAASWSCSNLQLKANDFFSIAKRLVMGRILTFNDRELIRPFFLKYSTSQAFKVMEIELSFVYEMLYTKLFAFHTKLGSFLHCFTLAFMLSSLIAFLIIKKHSYGEVDLVITYILLGGAVLLEFYSVGLLVFSEWAVIRLHNLKYFSWLSKIIFSIMSFFCWQSKPRWSNLMGQCNLITSCLSDRSPTFGWDKLWHTTSIDVTDELKDFILKVLKEVSMTANVSADYKHFTTCRGMDTLEKMDMKEKAVVDSVNNVEFDQSILLWHVASDICYHFTVENPNNRTKTQKISNALSNYMLYLLIVHHSMLTTTMGQVQYEGIYKQAKNLFQAFMCFPRNETMWERLLNIEGKSTLCDAVTLAKELLKLEKEKRWKLMSGVWVEMLCFAATHCKGYFHAKQLSDGGELLTFVWLLMTHLGLDRTKLENIGTRELTGEIYCE
ncbi:uncharacterized protein [Typha angustifolia]|uniref:uncharacterized protein n=1 Tax=Typha angustifolia TaxID=59011 RepID=UPI003C2F572C